jgi:hypothetical protein
MCGLVNIMGYIYLEMVLISLGAALIALFSSGNKVENNDININMTDLDKLLDLNKPFEPRNDENQGIN